MVLSRVGLTGATGMLGRHIRAVLERTGIQVAAVSRTCCPAGGAVWDLAEWRTPAELDALFPQVQAVVHAGAMLTSVGGPVDEARMFDANVRACVALGQWAIERNIPLVHISGAIVYRYPDRTALAEDSEKGYNGLGGSYGFSKLLAEDVLWRLCERGLRLAVVRPSSIYGAGLPATKMLSRFLATASAGGVIELTPPVCDRVNLVHAADVSEVVRAILEKDAHGAFNVAADKAVSIRELAQACIAVTGRGSVQIQEGCDEKRAPASRFALDIGRAKKLLGWSPLYDIERGLSEMLRQDAGSVTQ